MKDDIDDFFFIQDEEYISKALNIFALNESIGQIVFNRRYSLTNTEVEDRDQVGGIEVREISQLSEYISGTLQQGHIFNTTLRENLKIADSRSSDARLLEILRAVELTEIPLDELLGEFGRALSGGEAKRLSIARALLSSAPILILDEPLEHLDHERALRLQASIARISAGKSLIVITHSPWLQYSRKLELARE